MEHHRGDADLEELAELRGDDAEERSGVPGRQAQQLNIVLLGGTGIGVHRVNRGGLRGEKKEETLLARSLLELSKRCECLREIFGL